MNTYYIDGYKIAAHSAAAARMAARELAAANAPREHEDLHLRLSPQQGELDFALTCYQCEAEVRWLAPDSRCKDCTRLTPEEVRGW